MDYSIKLSNSSFSLTSQLNDGKLDTYGFDIEVNHSSFMNIGAFFRVEDPRSVVSILSQLSLLLGGFTRFFYTPPFLQSEQFPAHFFIRGDLGGGPLLLSTAGGAPSGMVLHMGASVGVEAYFTRWLGIGLSYGYNFKYGSETLMSGETGNESSTIWSQGRVLALTLKTTLF